MAQHIKEARELQSIAFNREDYKDLDVLFRLESIRGMLIIAHNDAVALVKNWEGGG